MRFFMLVLFVVTMLWVSVAIVVITSLERRRVIDGYVLEALTRAPAFRSELDDRLVRLGLLLPVPQVDASLRRLERAGSIVVTTAPFGRVSLLVYRLREVCDG